MILFYVNFESIEKAFKNIESNHASFSSSECNVL